MAEYISPNDIEMRASLGFVKDYFKEEADNSHTPPSDYNILLEMFENDTVLTTAIDTTVDVGTSSGFHFKGKNKRSLESIETLFYDTLDWDNVMQNIMYSMLIYGDAFLEIRWLDGSPNELHVLETTEMRIIYDEHGTVLGYVQCPSSNPSKKVYFSTEEVVHFKLKSIGSRVYSFTPFKSIMREFSTKKYASSYLSRIFLNFPPRLLYILKTANKEQTKAFIDNLKKAKNQPHKDLVGWGDMDVKETGVFDFSKGLTEILNYLRTEILMITKVPPIWIGIPDDSNRSNSEAQIRSFETRLKSIQNKISSAVNKQLLPALGYKGVEFEFNAFSLMEEKSMMEVAEKMRTIGFDDDSILEYLRDKGFKMSENASLENPQMALQQAKAESDAANRGADSNGTGRKTKVDGNGVSSKGKAKTESKQIRSIEPPKEYIIEAVVDE